MNDKQVLVDTMSAIQMSNGLVRLMFVNQDVEELAKGVAADQLKPQLRQCVTMPLPGFLFAVSVIEKFLNDAQLQEVMKKARESRLLADSGQASAAEPGG